VTDIILSGPADFRGWRTAAARLMAANVDPTETDWGCADEPLHILTANDEGEPAPAAALRLDAPKPFLALAKLVIQHQHAVRFALLYRLLWRLKRQPKLLESTTDSEVVVAQAMRKSVQDDINRMKATLSFHAVPSGQSDVSVAWYEPHHHIVETIAPFFVHRFEKSCFSILTPRLSAHWNGRDLVFGQGTGGSLATKAAVNGDCERPIPFRANLRFATVRGDRD
jgi:uracil-DNA glycosylase